MVTTASHVPVGRSVNPFERWTDRSTNFSFMTATAVSLTLPDGLEPAL